MNPALLALLAARVAVGAGSTITDSFNRANGAVGNADTGQTWTVSGTAAIANNKLSLTGTAAVSADLGTPNMSVQATLSSAVSYSQIQVRGDAYLLFISPDKKYGVRTSSGDIYFGVNAVGGDVMRLDVFEEAGGTRVVAYCNGASFYSTLDTGAGRNTTGTRTGLGSYQQGASFDNFSATAL